VLVMHAGYDRKSQKGWTNVEWFLRDGKRWRRDRERIEQVAWTQAEIRHTLRDAGFDRIRAWDAAPFFKNYPKMSPGCCTFYLARKSAS
jgi:hypothetical protein